MKIHTSYACISYRQRQPPPVRGRKLAVLPLLDALSARAELSASAPPRPRGGRFDSRSGARLRAPDATTNAEDRLNVIDARLDAVTLRVGVGVAEEPLAATGALAVKPLAHGTAQGVSWPSSRYADNIRRDHQRQSLGVHRILNIVGGAARSTSRTGSAGYQLYTTRRFLRFTVGTRVASAGRLSSSVPRMG